jgi:hypothetical protein
MQNILYLAMNAKNISESLLHRMEEGEGETVLYRIEIFFSVIAQSASMNSWQKAPKVKFYSCLMKGPSKYRTHLAKYRTLPESA